MYHMTSYFHRCRLYFRPLSRILAGVTEYLFNVDPTVCFRFRYSAFLLNRKPWKHAWNRIKKKKNTVPMLLHSIYLALSSMIWISVCHYSRWSGIKIFHSFIIHSGDDSAALKANINNKNKIYLFTLAILIPSNLYPKTSETNR